MFSTNSTILYTTPAPDRFLLMYLHPRCCGLTRIAPTSLGVSLGLFKLWWSNITTSVPYSFTILSIVLISFDEESTIINKSASLTILIFLSTLFFSLRCQGLLHSSSSIDSQYHDPNHALQKCMEFLYPFSLSGIE